MARDVIPYRRSRLKIRTIRASILVKCYEDEEFWRELVSHDSKPEAKKLEEILTLDDYRSWAERKDKGTERDRGGISDDDESHKVETAWSFLDQDGTPAYGREPRPLLPDCRLMESRDARPPPSRSQSQDVDPLAGSEESGEGERICHSTDNMYVAADTEGEEGSTDKEPQISGEEIGDLDHEGHSPDVGQIEPLAAHQAEVCSMEGQLGNTESFPVLRVTLGKGRTDFNTAVAVTTTKRTGTGGKEKKKSRLI